LSRNCSVSAGFRYLTKPPAQSSQIPRFVFGMSSLPTEWIVLLANLLFNL